jgi:hypothetical protein
MNRLNFLLHDWTRIIWVSEPAKSFWEPKIQKASQAFQNIEQELVLAGIKPANLTSMSHSDFIDKQISLSSSEFRLIPLIKTKATDQYSNTSQITTDKYNYTVRCVLLHKDYVDSWLSAWNTNNDEEIGRLLGYPKCCTDFFKKYWVDEQFVDTTYPMSLAGTVGPKECNILLRWIGIRAVSHLPCSFNCQHTYELGRKYLEFGRSLGYDEDIDVIEEMLDWPVSWSALHGIAEIKSPILKISSRTDATAELYEVKREGFSYPELGASGTSFPYINKSKIKITQSKSFKRSLNINNLWKDNGFYSLESMEYSHNILIEALTQSQISFKNVIDFGCGNAELLKKISKQFDIKDIYGVELDKERFDRIGLNISFGEFYNQNIFNKSADWLQKNIDLSIIMYGRFLEESSRHLIDWLIQNESTVLLYNYSDWQSESSRFVEYLNSIDVEFSNTTKIEGINCCAYVGKFVMKQKQKSFNII